METETAACCCAERGVEVQGCQEHSQEGAGQRGGGGLGGSSSSKLQLGLMSCSQCPCSGVSKKGVQQRAPKSV